MVALRVQNVSHCFGALQVLGDVHLEVASGEKRVILGPNGAGKTTLFNLIAGEHTPQHGKVFLFDEDVTRKPTRYRARRGLGRTFQQSQLFSGMTTWQNLYVAARGTKGARMSPARPRVYGPLDRTLECVAERSGLLDLLERPVRSLSHGEQRQLEIGMALAGGGRLVLLDEPAAGLSPGERIRVTDMLLNLGANVTLVMIEHDMDVALSVADCVTVMQSGRVIADGSVQAIRDDPRVHELYLGESSHD